jgi:hypothetical protein
MQLRTPIGKVAAIASSALLASAYVAVQSGCFTSSTNEGATGESRQQLMLTSKSGAAIGPRQLEGPTTATTAQQQPNLAMPAFPAANAAPASTPPRQMLMGTSKAAAPIRPEQLPLQAATTQP